MIGGVPIRVRLTLWYFTVLALSLLFISYAALSVMRSNIEDAVDDQMRGRIQVVRDLMEQQGTPLFGEELANGIKDYSSTRQLDLFLQVVL